MGKNMGKAPWERQISTPKPTQTSFPHPSFLPLLWILLGGALMGLTPAPLNAWPLAWFSLVPLWIQIDHARVLPLQTQAGRLFLLRTGLSKIFRMGAVWGVGYHGVALAWITHLHPLTWMGIPWLGSIAIALFAWGFITLWGATLVGTWAVGLYLLPTSPGVRILGGTALWCALETLWNQGPLWWTALAYTQSPSNLTILHLGQISGPVTIAAAIVVCNGLLSEARIRHQRSVVSGQTHSKASHLPSQGQGASSEMLIGIALTLVISLHLLGYFLYSQPLTTAEGNTLTVGIIQGNVPTRIKLTPAGERQALKGYTDGYESLVDQGVDMVITPEGSLPMVWAEASIRQNPLYQAIQEQEIPALVGAFGLNGDHITQSLLAVDSNGATVSRYDKVKLVPLGEYIPFSPILEPIVGRLSPLETGMLPGSPDQRFDTPFGRVAVGICYESAYSEIFRTQVSDGGEFLLMPSNDDPYPRWMMAQHHALDVMRAIELDRWAVRVTNTGLSGIVDPHGRTVWLSDRRIYTTHAATITRRQSQTPYVHWGNWLTSLLIILTALTLLIL